MSNKPIYSKRTIEIADYIFADPMAKRRDVLAKFGKKWQIPNRTFDRILKEAKEYNKNRIKGQEQAKDEVLTAQAKASVKSAILTRNEALKILSDIATGRARKIEKDILAPTDGDRTRAIQQLSKMEGWDAPAQLDINTAQDVIIQKSYE
jgi:hypothetical protein